MQVKTHLPLIAIALATVLAVVISAICIPLAREKKKDELYEKLRAATADYPRLLDQYQSTACYYMDGEVGYLFLQCGDRQATGVRDADGSIVYFVDGKSWRVDAEGDLAESDAAYVPVASIIEKAIHAYWMQENIAIAYKRNNGPFLPYGTSYEDKYYVSISRPGYETYTENMVCSSENEGEKLIWCIVDADGRSKMYLKIWDYKSDFYMRDWVVSEDIIRMLQSKN